MSKDKDYVLRGAFKQAVCRGMSVGARYAAECVYWGAEQGVKAIIQAIDEIPAEDVKPVVRGEWEDCAVKLDLRSNHHDYKCPKCGYPADYFICGSEDWWCAYEPNFCPHCGADMRKETNDEMEEH